MNITKDRPTPVRLMWPCDQVDSYRYCWICQGHKEEVLLWSSQDFKFTSGIIFLESVINTYIFSNQQYPCIATIVLVKWASLPVSLGKFSHEARSGIFQALQTEWVALILTRLFNPLTPDMSVLTHFCQLILNILYFWTVCTIGKSPTACESWDVALFKPICGYYGNFTQTFQKACVYTDCVRVWECGGWTTGEAQGIQRRVFSTNT